MLALAECLGGPMAFHLFAARLVAAGAFFSLLFALCYGLARARKQVLHDEADAALEADFQRLEREFSLPESETASATRQERS